MAVECGVNIQKCICKQCKQYFYFLFSIFQFPLFLRKREKKSEIFFLHTFFTKKLLTLLTTALRLDFFAYKLLTSLLTTFSERDLKTDSIALFRVAYTKNFVSSFLLTKLLTSRQVL